MVPILDQGQGQAIVTGRGVTTRTGAIPSQGIERYVKLLPSLIRARARLLDRVIGSRTDRLWIALPRGIRCLSRFGASAYPWIIATMSPYR